MTPATPASPHGRSDAAGERAKLIARFDPATRVGPVEAERHYSDVHFPFARELLLGMPQVRSYHVNRVLRQLDLHGGWRQRPTAWRFVVLSFDPTRSLEFPPATVDRITRDHLNFLRRLRSTPVRERVTLDRLAGQTVLCKYLIEVDALPGTRGDEIEGLAGLESLVAARAAGAPGLRLVRCNRVLAELIAEPVEEDGQRATDRPLARTEKLGYIEVYADDWHFGDAMFADVALRDAITSTALDARAYAVEERCGFDRGAGGAPQ